MPIKMKTKYGLITYKLTDEECIKAGFGNICDSCNTTLYEDNYFIPILNNLMCHNCYEIFSEKAKFYQEDEHIEERRTKLFESLFYQKSEVI